MARERIALFVLSILPMLMVCCLGYTADISFQTKLVERIDSLEKRGLQQDETMLTMASRLEDQERTISDYKLRVSDLEHRLAVQERTANDYKQRITDLEQTVAELNLKHHPDVGDSQGDSTSVNNQTRGITRQGQSESANSRSASMRIRRALVNTEAPVAFHAVIKAPQVDHLGVNQNIVFPNVFVNLGGGYHVQHGIFVAPQPGVYIFSVSIMARDIANHPEVYVHLIKNGHTLANAYAHADAGRWDQGSVTAVTQLAAADEVWVSLYGPGTDASTHGDYYDSFMGCLVIPL